MADAIPNTTAPPEEGFLHSIATSIGVDPEAVRSAAKSFYDHPVDSAQAVGSEAVDEISDAAKHPIETAKTAGKGVVSAVTNPDAQATAKTRFAQPGVSNKLAGIGEYLTSGVPLVGGNLVKSEEQAARGNVRGSSGTLLGTIAPALLDTEGGQAVKTHLADTARAAVDSIKTEGKAALEAKAPEGSLEAGFAKLGGKKVGGTPSGDPHVYHVTYLKNLDSIAEDGLQPNQGSGIGGPSLAQYKKGKVFVSDARGLSLWTQRAEDFAYHNSDDLKEDGLLPVVTRVPIADIDSLDADEEGSRDSGGKAFSAEHVPAHNMEVWNGHQWEPVGSHSIDPEEHFDEDGYLKNDELRQPQIVSPNVRTDAGAEKPQKMSMPQGGHAGGGVASVEEINRPGRFVKVSKSGQLTDQGKTPDFNLRNGEVGYQVKPDGTYEVKDGQEGPAHARAIQQYAKTIYPVKGDLSSAYGATGKALNVISPSYPTARRDAVPDFISKAPEGKLAQDAPAAAKVKQFVEDNGGVFRGMQVDKVGDKRIGLVHFDVPPEMVGGKKNVTASISIDKATPAGIKAKVAEMAAKHQPKIGEYPQAGKQADGLTVGDKVSNMSSISASLSDHEIQSGVKELPMSEFSTKPRELFYAANDLASTRQLADTIKTSGRIDPLIVVVDKDGPYVLEGAHRLGALDILGKKSFPAIVVHDISDTTGIHLAEKHQ